jgi:predicted ester cyclase
VLSELKQVKEVSMGGCGVLDDPCEAPEPDPPSPEDRAAREVVREFINRVWNHRWTQEEDSRFVDERAKGNRAYVPKAIEDALRDLRTPQTIRHRYTRQGRPVRSSGADDYATCVNRVHEVAQGLKFEFIDLAVSGDRVVAHMIMRGTDRRLPGLEEGPGAFGVQFPTGQKFSVHVATMYRVAHEKIHDDWLLRRAEVSYEQHAAAA